MKNSITVNKPGRTKEQLLESLDNLKSEFAKEISENDVNIIKITDGYNIKGEKKILFMTFWVNSDIIAGDNEFELSWDTNAPEGKVNEAMKKIVKILEEC